jgi:hypothetical protein
MLGVWMIDFVHSDCTRIVVYGNIYTASDSKLNPSGRPAAAGKVIDNNFIQYSCTSSLS